MKTAPAVLATAHDAASLIARLALQTRIPAAILEEVRGLLATYPPRRIARALDEAISLSIIAGRTPVWPPTRDVQALQDLLLGLLDLADQTQLITYSLAA